MTTPATAPSWPATVIAPPEGAAWASLTGPHAYLALGRGRARRYPAQFSPFAAVSDIDDDRAWVDLAELCTPDEVIVIAGPTGSSERLPADWAIVGSVPGVQLVATDAHRTGPDDKAFVIGADDVAEAIDLVARTEPGPFRPETYRLGTYLGIRRGGRLVALAGERLHPPGWGEISAVCTDPDFRRQGLATRLVRAVGDLIRARGERPFLHTGAANTRAIDLYLSIGYELRRDVEFLAVQAPARDA